MDAVKFIKEKRRMCLGNTRCHKCSAYELGCVVTEANAERMVDAVEKWSEEHPIITNRRKIKEVFGKEFIGEVMMNLSGEWLDAEYKQPKEDER